MGALVHFCSISFGFAQSLYEKYRQGRHNEKEKNGEGRRK